MTEIIIGYIIVFIYLIVAFLLSIAISKITKNNELSRKTIHILAGLVWIVFKVTMPCTIHVVFESLFFVLITVLSSVTNFSFMEREQKEYGTIYFTVSMTVMAIISYLYNDWFDAFGVAIISLSIGDGIACIIGSRFGKNSIKLYKEKSLIGSLSGILSTTIVLNIISNIFDMELHIGHILTLAVLTGIVELYSGKYDNIAISFTVFITAFLFMSGSIFENIIITLIASIASSIIFVNLKLVKKSAAPFLMILFFCVIYFGETNIYLSLICTYVPLFIVDKIFDKRIKNVTTSINQKTGARDFAQVFVNCFPVVCSIVLWGLFKSDIFVVVLFASLCETVSDSMSSDIGVMSKSQPISIISFKPIQTGMSGGVSTLGTLSGIFTSLFCGLLYLIFWKGDFLHFGIIVLSGYLGVLLDSVLGATIQAKYFCEICKKHTEKVIHCQQKTQHIGGIRIVNNCAVNFICNVFSCSIATLAFLLWR